MQYHPHTSTCISCHSCIVPYSCHYHHQHQQQQQQHQQQQQQHVLSSHRHSNAAIHSNTSIHHHYHYLPSPTCCQSHCYTAAPTSSPSSSFSMSPVSISSTTTTSSSTSSAILKNKHKKETPSSISRHPHLPSSSPSSPKQNQLLYHAILELIQSEKDYIHELSIIVDICLALLHQQKWIPATHVAIMSRNLSDILNFHRKLFAAFHASYDHRHTTHPYTSQCRTIAHAFLQHETQFMALYLDYCDGHAQAWHLCTEYRARPEWHEFILECQTLIQLHDDQASLSSSIKRIRFEDFLIKPIQRICRYQLFIREILRHSHPNLFLEKALESMLDIATEIDRRNETRELQERTTCFIERLVSDWRLSPTRVAQLGCLLMSGALDIKYYSSFEPSASSSLPPFSTSSFSSPSSPSSSSSSPPLKSRYLGCFVFPSYVIMVHVKKQSVYEAKHWFPLHIVDIVDNIKDPNAFLLQCQYHVFICTATCVKEKQIWIEKIKLAQRPSYLPPHDGLVSSLHHPPPPLLRSLETDDDHRPSSPQSYYHPHRLPSSCSSPSLLTTSQRKRFSSPHPQPPCSNTTFNATTTATATAVADTVTAGPTTSLPPPRRHSSLDLFTMATHNLNRVSLHLKTQHQNALREAVDQRLRDVCTRDYLAARRHWMLDRHSSVGSASTSPPPSSSSSSSSPSPPPLPHTQMTTTTTTQSRSTSPELAHSIGFPSSLPLSSPPKLPRQRHTHARFSTPLVLHSSPPPMAFVSRPVPESGITVSTESMPHHTTITATSVPALAAQTTTSQSTGSHSSSPSSSRSSSSRRKCMPRKKQTGEQRVNGVSSTSRWWYCLIRPNKKKKKKRLRADPATPPPTPEFIHQALPSHPHPIQEEEENENENEDQDEDEEEVEEGKGKENIEKENKNQLKSYPKDGRGEEGTVEKYVSNHNARSSPPSPASSRSTLYSDFQLYRRSLNLD